MSDMTARAAPAEPTLMLNAVTSPESITVDLGEIRTSIALQTVVTGSPSTVAVDVEVSLDGVHWAPSSLTSSSTTGDYHAVTTGPIRWVLVALTAMTGGTAPTLTALVAAA